MSVLEHLRRPGWPRRGLFALGLLLALAIICRVLLDPLVAHFTRKELNVPETISCDFQKVHVSLFPPGYEIWHLKIIEAAGGDWRQPLFYADHARISIDWRRLIHAELALRLLLDEPKLIVAIRPVRASQREHAQPELMDVGGAIRKLIPARVEELEVRMGEFLFRDLTAPRHPEIWVHRIELGVENLATRRSHARGHPATVRASATLGRSGAVTFFAAVDPLAAKPEFGGTLAVRGWRVAELYDLEEPATGLQTPKGTLDLFADFKAHGGAISGGVKPVLKNVEVRPTEEGFGNKLKAWVADKGLHLFSDRDPRRIAVATVVPIEGRLDKPDVQLWPTILGVVRNAFVEGISAGFESLWTRTKHALPSDEAPPKAQPPRPDR